MSKQHSYREDGDVQCPYYCRENSIGIKCQGLCGTHTLSQFTSKKEKEEYKEDFCIGYYWNCPLCIALDDENNYERPERLPTVSAAKVLWQEIKG